MNHCSGKLETNMPFVKAIVICCFLAISVLASPAIAQSTNESFDQLWTQWTELDSQMAVKEAAAISGGPEEMKAFTDLVDQANTVLGELKTCILDQLNETPKDKKLLKTILGIMINDAQFDRDSEVLQVGEQLVQLKINPRYFEVAARVERLPIPGRELFEELTIRAREARADDNPRVKLSTTQGDIVLELFEDQAPNTVANFISLVEKGFYDGTKFHRVLESFVAQAGCPDGNGLGGPGYEIKGEAKSPDARRHFVGSISMALEGFDAPDSGGSQFFLTLDRTPKLDGFFTVFGRIVDGAGTLEKLARTHMLVNNLEQKIPNVKPDQITKASVMRKREHAYQPVKVTDQDESESDSQPAPRTPRDEPSPEAPSLNSPSNNKESDKVETSDGKEADKT